MSKRLTITVMNKRTVITFYGLPHTMDYITRFLPQSGSIELPQTIFLFLCCKQNKCNFITFLGSGKSISNLLKFIPSQWTDQQFMVN